MPVPPTADGEDNFTLIIERVCEFLGPMKELPILFSEGSVRHSKFQWRTARKVMEALLARSGKPELVDELKVYPVDELSFIIERLQNCEQQQSIVVTYANLNIDCFEYATKGCEYHEKDDSYSSNCCLSKVRRVGYMIFI